MAETPQGIRYPAISDTPDVPRDIKNAATDVDTKFLRFMEGTHAARPAPEHANRFYYETDTVTLFRDTGAAWVQVKTGPNPAYFLTGVVANNVITTGKIVTPSNTLVRYSARIRGSCNAGTDGFAVAKLKRDGVQVAEQTVIVCKNGQGEGNAQMVLDFIQAAGGEHEWKVEIVWAGTAFAGTIDPGTLSLMS